MILHSERICTGLSLTAISVLVTGLFLGSPAYGHEEGAPFSGAIIDPMRVHHAHIENEQRINLFGMDEFATPDATKKSAFGSSLELAIDWTGKFRFGSELLVPFSNSGVDQDSYGIGDIEVWPIKYAFISTPETIVTGALSLTLPTGSENSGLGSGSIGVGAFLFFDHAYRNWFWGINTEFGTNVSGVTAADFEVASVIAYSFIDGTGDGMAPTKPTQKWVPSLSIEIISESRLNGEDEGENIVTVLPGLNLWQPASGWTMRIGVEIPVSFQQESDFTVLLQVGNHINWKRIFR